MSLRVAPALWMSRQWWMFFHVCPDFCLGFTVVWLGFTILDTTSHLMSGMILYRMHHTSPPFWRPFFLRQQPVPAWFSSLHLFWKRIFEDKWQGYFYGPDVLHVRRPAVSKHWRILEAWTPVSGLALSFLPLPPDFCGKGCWSFTLHLASGASILIECTTCLKNKSHSVPNLVYRV